MLQRTLREEKAEKAAKLPEGDRNDGREAEREDRTRSAREMPTDPNSNNTGVAKDVDGSQEDRKVTSATDIGSKR